MGFTIWQALIICPLIFLAGFIDAIAGGGGLISLPAYMIAGFPVHVSIASNKLSSAMGTTFVTIKYFMDGFIPVKISCCSMIFALIGSGLGAKTALLISDGIFKILMLIILPATAFYVMKSKKLLTEHEQENLNEKKIIIICAVIALFLGFYDGFYGPGAGTFMMILLCGWARLNVQRANGVAKAMNMATNLAALTVYFLNGKVILILGLMAGIFSIIGNYVGAKFFEKGGANIVRPVIFIVLILFLIRVISDLI